MTDRPSIEIRGKGEAYFILQDGQPLPRRFWSYDNAAVAAQRLEERLLDRGASVRPCICCDRLFNSMHRFNRLCLACAEELA